MSEVVSFGCRLNAYESAVIRQQLADEENDNTIVINTCAVTAEAERQARQEVRRQRRTSPDAHIVATGCAVQINPDAWSGLREVDSVIGNAEKMQPETWKSTRDVRTSVTPIGQFARRNHALPANFEGRARAFVEIQNGCDHSCTFCIIPSGRGASRSVPDDVIVDQIRDIVSSGVREVVLTGVDITSWGNDLPGSPGLGFLVRTILHDIPELDRLRTSSLDPAELDDEFCRIVAEEERLLPCLHLSLQSGDPLVLKRMKRRHSPDDAHRLCARLRSYRPDIVFGADLIAGFPTESDEMFENTLAHIDACGLTWLHVFPYSERPGTSAARMPQVPVPVRKERARRLRDAGHAAANRFLESRIGSNARVLVEKTGFGRSEHNAPVRLPSCYRPGDIHVLPVTGSDSGLLQTTDH